MKKHQESVATIIRTKTVIELDEKDIINYLNQFHAMPVKVEVMHKIGDAEYFVVDGDNPIRVAWTTEEANPNAEKK